MTVLHRKPNLAEKIEMGISAILALSLVAAIVVTVITGDWFNLFISVVALILVLLPDIFERVYRIDLPWEFEFLIVIFVYASVFLGEVRNFYANFSWWDTLLHGISGLALAFAGFMIIYVLYKQDKIDARPWLVAIFAFCFAVALGAVWEIFEFAMDSAFGTNMQKNGLVDTMWDLIVDSAGALIVSLLGFIYLKYGKVRFFDRILKRFEKDNPRLFH